MPGVLSDGGESRVIISKGTTRFVRHIMIGHNNYNNGIAPPPRR